MKEARALPRGAGKAAMTSVRGMLWDEALKGVTGVLKG